MLSKIMCSEGFVDLNKVNGQNLNNTDLSFMNGII